MRILMTMTALLLLLAPDTGAQQIRVGQPFPDLVLPSIEDGSPTSIASYRGKKVFLHVFASW